MQEEDTISEPADQLDSRAHSTLISKNVTVLGRRTSVRLEPEMWVALRDIAMRERCSTHDICSLIALRKQSETSLTAAIRVFLMLYYRAAATDEGHRRAGHGNFEMMRQRAGVRRNLNRPFHSEAIGDKDNDVSLDETEEAQAS